MGIKSAYNNFVSSIGEKLNPAQVNIVDDMGTTHSPSSNLYTNQAAYSTMPTVNRGVNLISDAVSEINFDVGDTIDIYQTESRLRKKKLATLLNFSPNPYYNADIFRRNIIIDLLLEGNAYIYFDGAYLYNLPALNVTIESDKVTFIKSYTYANKKFLPNEIIHIRESSADSIFKGKSRLDSVRDTILLLKSMNTFQKTFFDNSAVPGLVISTPNPMSDRIKQRILSKWMQDYNPKRGGKRPMILDGDFKIEPMSKYNFKELDFTDSIKNQEDTILKALGIPPILLDTGNNANITPNLRMFYINNIIPLVNKITRSMEVYFGYDIKPVLQDVLALRPEMKDSAAYYTALTNAGIISRNEAREELRLAKSDDPTADDLILPANIAGSAVDPSQGGAPPAKKEGEDGKK